MMKNIAASVLKNTQKISMPIEVQRVRAIDTSLPEGVLATARGEVVFLQNFSG